MTPDNSIYTQTDMSQYTRIVNIVVHWLLVLLQPSFFLILPYFQKNMSNSKYSKAAKVVVPVHTISNPSPPKRSASNRYPGQMHTCTPVDEAIAYKLAKAQYLMHDLADHILGHIVLTELAVDILHQFIHDGVIQVLKGMGPCHNNNPKVPLNPNSNEVQMAIQQAFEKADRHNCIKLDIEGNCEELESLSTDVKGKGKQKTKMHLFRWTTFPTEPLCEGGLVSFLNNITDCAFFFMKPKLAINKPNLHHRFAASEDKNCAILLSYKPDGEDM